MYHTRLTTSEDPYPRVLSARAEDRGIARHRDGQPVDAHCRNVLPDESHLDLTRDQFEYEFELGEPLEKEPVVDHTGVDRHELLARRVAALLERQ